MYLQAGNPGMSHFLKSVILNKPIKVVKIDRSTMDYFMRLTNFYSQFQAAGVNYNQTVKAVKTSFSEKKGADFASAVEKSNL
jgi:hypothetical protein